MEDLELIEHLNNSSLRIKRIFRYRYNPLKSFNDIDFIELIVWEKSQYYFLLWPIHTSPAPATVAPACILMTMEFSKSM